MKRTLTLILTVLMLCTLLFGCGQKSGDGDPQDTNTEPALADGVYTADFSTDSSMFHANEACDGKGTLTVENGVPLIRGLPISNLSDGELLELCVDISVSKPGQLQIILVDGAERLDKESRDRLYAKCKEKGLQLIATRVTDSDALEVTEL